MILQNSLKSNDSVKLESDDYIADERGYLTILGSISTELEEGLVNIM